MLGSNHSGGLGVKFHPAVLTPGRTKRPSRMINVASTVKSTDIVLFAMTDIASVVNMIGRWLCFIVSTIGSVLQLGQHMMYGITLCIQN